MKKGKNNKSQKHSSLEAASIIRSATAQAERHHDNVLAYTGTNISYEGATAPGSGGSVGTGHASGKEAVDATISTNSDYEQNREDDKEEEDGAVILLDDDFYLDDSF